MALGIKNPQTVQKTALGHEEPFVFCGLFQANMLQFLSRKTGNFDGFSEITSNFKINAGHIIFCFV